MDILPANRVFQLEAQNVSNEINKIVNNLVDNLNIPKISEEIKLLLKFYIQANHVNQSTTFGLKACNLHYYDKISKSKIVPARNYKLMLLVASNLILPYLMRRVDRFKLTWPSWDSLDLLVKSINVFNFLIFLSHGKQLLFMERILGLHPGITSENYLNNFAIMKSQMIQLNREIIWMAIADFLTAIIPIVNTQKIRNKVLKFTRLTPELIEDGSVIATGAILNVNKCAICDKQPFNPYVIGCKHVFCYYCLHSRHLSDPSQGFTCSICKYKARNETQVMRLDMNAIKLSSESEESLK